MWFGKEIQKMPLSSTTNPVTKAQLLKKEAGKIKKCKECKEGKLGLAVPGEGNPAARIVFIGEAPGKEEAKTGRPFVGRSGKFLRSLIAGIGLKDKDVYITSPVKYLPLKGTPSEADIAHGATHLLRQIEIIQPELMVLLGNVAAKACLPAGRALLKNQVKISKDHGKVFKQNNKIYFLTFHPAAAVRFQKIKILIEEDFKKLKRLMTGLN